VAGYRDGGARQAAEQCCKTVTRSEAKNPTLGIFRRMRKARSLAPLRMIILGRLSAACKAPPVKTRGEKSGLAVAVAFLAWIVVPSAIPWALGGQPRAAPGTPVFLSSASSQKPSDPLDKDQVVRMLQGGVSSQRIEAMAREDGIDFTVTLTVERELRKAGATDKLIRALKGMSSKSPSHPDSAGDLPALLKTAQDALNRKDFPEAIKALQVVVAKQPDLAAAWFNLGFAYTGLHQDTDAINAYQKALEIEPAMFEARLNLGILFLEGKQPQAALEHLQKATTLKPDHVRAHLYYGRALAQCGQTEAAAKQYQEVVRLDPQTAIAQFDLGQLELQQKHSAEALAAFEKAVVLDPQLIQAELGAALAAEDLKDNAQAIGHFEKYLAIRPDDLETRFHLARLYLKQNENQKARDRLEAVYRTKPDMPGLTAALGDVCALLKKLPDAERYYRLAVAANPGDSDIHRALGQTLLDEEKYPDAEKEFRAALGLNSHSREAAYGLALSVYFQKRFQEAIPLLEQIGHAPDPPAFLFYLLGTSYDQLRARKEALANYERFLQASQGRAPDYEWKATQRAKLLRRMLGK
jgi:tetratricopeptide (TPR) repeat protein